MKQEFEAVLEAIPDRFLSADECAAVAKAVDADDFRAWGETVETNFGVLVWYDRSGPGRVISITRTAERDEGEESFASAGEWEATDLGTMTLPQAARMMANAAKEVMGEDFPVDLKEPEDRHAR